MFTLKRTIGALPFVATAGLAVMLSACNTLPKSDEPDSVANNETRDYYYEESTKPGKARVIDPEAATFTPRPSAINREQEARDAVRDQLPGAYTVQKGDTLWDISGRFLSKPWLWPEIWDVNPQIENPHLIYPGDEVALRWVDGKPTIIVMRNGETIDTLNRSDMPMQDGVRLSPTIREESLANAIPTIPGDAIQQFLVYPRVVDEDTVKKSPYVIGDFEGRLASASGHQVYVRGEINPEQSSYGVFRRNKALVDPDSGEELGVEITHVSDARLLQTGDPATMLITAAKMETIAGDRVLSQNQNYVVHNYVPRVPQIEGEGKIVSLFNAISQTGRNQVVVVNLGDREGVRVGDVMAIEHRGGRIRDRFSGKPHDYVDIPNTRIGVLMVFRTFDKVSYGLIMESTRPIHLHDSVTGI